MAPGRSRAARPARRLLAAPVLLTMLATALVAPQAARGAPAGLPLGDRDLLEVRVVEQLASGVQLTRIVRGVVPAAPAVIPTTTRGPWRVTVLSIDPGLARGRLQAAYGPDLARSEPTSRLVQSVGGLAGVNASFFTFTKNPAYPGDPVGLGLYRGTVSSEPAAVKPEVDFVVDAATGKVTIGRLTWTGRMKNRKTGDTLKLEFLNHPPVVPKSCAKLTDPTACGRSGDVVHFQRLFGPTPSGRGVEVVLDGSGCVVRTAKKRGTTLTGRQTSVQATGKETGRLLKLVRTGCLSRQVSLLGENRKKIKLRSSLFGVAGRYRLTKEGRVVVPSGTGSFFARNPRTLAGTTSSGKILLVTIDGRRETSVGATLAEAGAVAHSLGLRDAVNLDGGGSTSMVVRGQVVNQLSGSAERAVGDALVYVDQPFR